MKHKKYYNLIIIVQLLFLLLVKHSNAQSVQVTNNYRISHPAHMMTNMWTGERDPWNQDATRIMMYEAYTLHPDYPTARAGKGLIWGVVSELRATANSSNPAEWEAVAKPIGGAGQSSSTYGTHAVWSALPNETNIIYAVRLSDKMLVRINTDTGSISNVISVSKADSSQPALSVLGWTSDNPPHLIVNFNAENWGSGYEVSGLPSAPQLIYYNSWQPHCSAGMSRFPMGPKEIHGTRSPDKLWYFRYSGSTAGNDGVCNNDYTSTECVSKDACYNNGQAGTKVYYDSNPSQLTHLTMRQDGWFLGANAGNNYITYKSNPNTPPRIETYKVTQVLFDSDTGVFTHNTILQPQSAAFRQTTMDDGDHNYQGGIPTPTLRNDGLQFMYNTTNGEWSWEDNRWCQTYSDPICSTIANEGYVMNAVFLADLTTVAGSQTCTSFTYSDWGACQSNNTQTRTVTSSSPSGCTGGTPVLTQSCTYSSGTPALTILKTSNTPTLDGNLTEYNNANSITFSPASGGNTITVKPLWTSEALYLGVNVTDTQLNASATTRDGSVWSDDSVEWFIDTYYDGGGSSTPNSAYMKVDDYQGIVSILNTKYDSQGTTSGTPSSSWNGTWQSAVKLSGTANTNTDTDTGYSIEIKIPWTSIGYSTAPSSDTLVGMSFAVNDKDASGVNSKMWLSSASSNQNASNWQRILLSGTLTTADVVPPAPPVALMIR